MIYLSRCASIRLDPILTGPEGRNVRRYPQETLSFITSQTREYKEEVPSRFQGQMLLVLPFVPQRISVQKEIQQLLTIESGEACNST